jgi:F0F1-type ATP synthase membrane subunit c/vacuolar-type H+-ATPase subunit K
VLDLPLLAIGSTCAVVGFGGGTCAAAAANFCAR